MKKTILVVGGAGYIGSHTVRYLMERGISCVVLDNLSYGHREAVLSPHFHEADLLDKASLGGVFDAHAIDAVVHFAALIAVGESVTDPRKYYENNVAGTLNLLQSMLDHGVRDIVFSSTCAVYGNPRHVPLDESHPLDPISPYARTKLMIEHIFRDYERAYGLRHISLRYFNASGAAGDGSLGESHNPETHLIPLVLRAIAGKGPAVRIFGTDYETPDGTCLRDYIHVEDLAEAHALALEKLETFSGSINLGTGVPTSVREIVAAAESVTGGRCPVDIGPRREGDPAMLYAANSFALDMLGWTPKYTKIDAIIATAWNWECHRRY